MALDPRCPDLEAEDWSAFSLSESGRRQSPNGISGAESSCLCLWVFLGLFVAVLSIVAFVFAGLKAACATVAIGSGLSFALMLARNGGR